jgi:hypothetical protein
MWLEALLGNKICKAVSVGLCNCIFESGFREVRWERRIDSVESSLEEKVGCGLEEADSVFAEEKWMILWILV